MAEETKPLVESLQRKRGIAKAAMSRVENFCNTSLTEANNKDLNIRMEMLERAYIVKLRN